MACYLKIRGNISTNCNVERQSLRSYMGKVKGRVITCYRVGRLLLCGEAVNYGLTRQLHARGWFNPTSLGQAPIPACNLDQNYSANWRRGMVVWPGEPYHHQKLISGIVPGLPFATHRSGNGLAWPKHSRLVSI